MDNELEGKKKMLCIQTKRRAGEKNIFCWRKEKQTTEKVDV